MFFIVCALAAEARPLISALSLRKDEHVCPYDTYFDVDSTCVLVLSGMGNVAASSATSYLLTRFQFQPDQDFLLNFGSCAGKQPGLYLIHKITDSVTGRDFYPDMLYDLSSCGLPLSSEKELVTVPKVISSLPDPDLLYEMEASGIYQAASRFCPPHRMIFLKYVSDAGEEDPKKITPALLTKKADEQIQKVLSLLQYLKEDTSEEEQIDEDLFISTCLDLRLSETMRHELRQLFLYAKASGCDIEAILSDLENEEKIPCRSKKEGKEVLDVIKDRLL